MNSICLSFDCFVDSQVVAIRVDLICVPLEDHRKVNIKDDLEPQADHASGCCVALTVT